MSARRSMSLLTLALSIAGFGGIGSGCAHYDSRIPGVVRPADPGSYQVIDRFSFVIRRKWALFGAIPVQRGDIDVKIEEVVRDRGGDGAVNVKIYERQHPGDVCLSLIVCGTGSHLLVEGDIIKFE